MRLFVGSLLTVLLASPAVAAVAEDAGLIVQLEIELPTQGLELDDPDAFPVRVEPGEDVELTLRVFAPEDGETPLPVEDSSQLIEIRDVSGDNAPLRFADMTELSPGIYATSHRFTHEGEFVLVVLPGVEDRTTLHSENTGDVRFVVGDDATPAPVDSASSVVTSVVVILLILLVAGAVVVATRKRPSRRHEKKAPGFAEAGRDSWWGS